MAAVEVSQTSAVEVLKTLKQFPLNSIRLLQSDDLWQMFGSRWVVRLVLWQGEGINLWSAQRLMKRNQMPKEYNYEISQQSRVSTTNSDKKHIKNAKMLIRKMFTNHKRAHGTEDSHRVGSETGIVLVAAKVMLHNEIFQSVDESWCMRNVIAKVINFNDNKIRMKFCLESFHKFWIFDSKIKKFSNEIEFVHFFKSFQSFFKSNFIYPQQFIYSSNIDEWTFYVLETQSNLLSHQCLCLWSIQNIK